MSAVAVAQRYRGPADLFSPVIVRDMWLTGVDTPSLCPMYMGSRCAGRRLKTGCSGRRCAPPLNRNVRPHGEKPTWNPLTS
jgi:hypothetical protein